jgi:hypothetical protein
MERAPDEALRDLLDDGEKLLWTGRPRQGFFLRAADGFAIPFSMIGVYMMVGRFFVDAWQRARTWYGLTSQRVLILSVFVRRNVKSLNLRALSAITLSERDDGVGSITFGPVPPSWPYRGAQMPGMSAQPPRFDNIPQARAVFDQIRSLQA